ncbi:hypothetical protein SAMN05660733_05374 [Lentzea albidocapillata]|uniref:Uncharacterized protein n=1 Tax=Lentzea albidocapillata TaxID=40571 RepID=A0A1W2F8V2_9PSEU|nr:hypothetical protein SAMN05660733_05374 [Lentzea albidocapillata]
MHTLLVLLLEPATSDLRLEFPSAEFLNRARQHVPSAVLNVMPSWGCGPRDRTPDGNGQPQRRPSLTHFTICAIVWSELTLAKSLWSENGLWFSSGKASSWYWPFSCTSRAMS